MRVTTLQSQDQRIAEIQREEERLQAAQDRVSTGLRVQRPSDAPGAIADLLRTRSDIAGLTQQKESATASLTTMQASDAPLGDIATALRQAQTAALQANNATTSPEQRAVLAGQIDQLRERIRSLSNTEVGGRYLFAGTNTDAAPFSAGPPVSYSGNDRPLQLSLPGGAEFATSVTGKALLNARGNTDLFQNLTSLAAAIRAGDTNAIGAGLTGLQSDLDNVAQVRGDLGARVQYVTWVQQRAGDDLVAAQNRQSQLQDADLASAVTEEKSAELANQATLAMTAKLGQPSLLDYLR